MMGLHILLVGDEADHADAMRRALVRMEAGVRVTTAARLERALEALRDPAIRCVVTDVRLPDADGVRVLQALRRARRELPVIVVTANGSEELAVAAMKLGAADYVSRHARYTEELPVLVREALGRSVLSGVHEACLDGGVPALAGPDAAAFVATTANMRAVLGLVERAALSAVPVLLEGETGTGKELLACAIHRRGPRPQAPFLAQNCAAIAEALLESELFGHVRGAFTGAERDRRGLFEVADGGTLFLDEIADTGAAMQAKLLRVLQDGSIRRVGDSKTRKVDVRVVVATQHTLAE